MTTGRWPLAVACVALGLFAGSYLTQQVASQPGGAAPAPAPAPAMPGREWQSFAPVVKKVAPAVVLIEGKGRAKRPVGEDTDPGFGSGFIVDPTGVVLTNSHVVNELDAVEVTLADGRKFASSDIRRDPKSDVALIKLDTKDPLPFVELGDSDLMEVGDRVLAFGAPFGLTGSVSSGIVCAKGRKGLNLNQFEDFIQTDAAVNPGNSGGPLVNMDGKVIGLTSAIKTRSGGFQGVGLAVSSNLAKKVSDELLKNGVVKRPYVGVSVRDLDEATAKPLGLKPNTGAVVTAVSANSPADKAGVVVGDVITSVNDVPVKDAAAFHAAVAALPVGETVDVLLMRTGKLYVGKVKVENEPRVALKPEPAPADKPSGATSATVGIAVTDVTPDILKAKKLPDAVKGVVVAGVTRNGLAERAGVTRGVIVVQVDRTPIATAAEFDKALQAASAEKGAVLHVLKSNGDVDFIVLPLK